MEEDTLRLFADAEIEILMPETSSADPGRPHTAVADGPRHLTKTVTGSVRNVSRRVRLGASLTQPHGFTRT
jgi:hypothetical protein